MAWHYIVALELFAANIFIYISVSEALTLLS